MYILWNIFIYKKNIVTEFVNYGLSNINNKFFFYRIDVTYVITCTILIIIVYDNP